jgi:hypothetical protein
MANVRKIMVDGRERDAVEAEFEPGSELWCSYKLMDGGTVRVRATASKIFVVLGDDGKPLLTNQGDPLVNVDYNVQITASM